MLIFAALFVPPCSSSLAPSPSPPPSPSLHRSFEMPFNIWCGKCGEMVAKGERFNAENKAMGMYHSTKILQFSMRHHCGCTVVGQTGDATPLRVHRRRADR